MSSIRHSLLDDRREQEDWRRGLGLMLLCVLISVWIHLTGFFIWERLDQNAADHFVFELQAEHPTMELTLVFNEPVTPLEILSETAETGAGEGALAGADSAETGGPPLSDAEEAMLTAMAAALPGLNGDLAASQPLPAEELVDPTPVNPEPPISVEGQAPDRKSYYTAIRMAVNKHWIIPPAAKDRYRPGRLTVDFTISPQGEVWLMVVIGSTGNAILDHAGQEAIRSAAPFPPFPDDLKKFSQLEIRMHFDYKAQYLPRLANP